MSFFSDLFGTGGDVKTASTQTTRQKLLVNSMLNQAIQKQGTFRPFSGSKVPLAPNANMQAIFSQLGDLINRNNAPSTNNNANAQALAQKAQETMAGGQGGESQDSIAEIVHKGQSNIISKILKLVNGGQA